MSLTKTSLQQKRNSNFQVLQRHQLQLSELPSCSPDIHQFTLTVAYTQLDSDDIMAAFAEADGGKRHSICMLSSCIATPIEFAARRQTLAYIQILAPFHEARYF